MHSSRRTRVLPRCNLLLLLFCYYRRLNTKGFRFVISDSPRRRDRPELLLPDGLPGVSLRLEVVAVHSIFNIIIIILNACALIRLKRTRERYRTAKIGEKLPFALFLSHFHYILARYRHRNPRFEMPLPMSSRIIQDRITVVLILNGDPVALYCDLEFSEHRVMILIF
jgi:hypothetical protein